MATNVVASRPPERRPTATPTARAKKEDSLKNKETLKNEEDLRNGDNLKMGKIAELRRPQKEN